MITANLKETRFVPRGKPKRSKKKGDGKRQHFSLEIKKMKKQGGAVIAKNLVYGHPASSSQKKRKEEFRKKVSASFLKKKKTKAAS